MASWSREDGLAEGRGRNRRAWPVMWRHRSSSCRVSRLCRKLADRVRYADPITICTPFRSQDHNLHTVQITGSQSTHRSDYRITICTLFRLEDHNLHTVQITGSQSAHLLDYRITVCTPFRLQDHNLHTVQITRSQAAHRSDYTITTCTSFRLRAHNRPQPVM